MMKMKWLKSLVRRAKLVLLIVKLVYWRHRALSAFDELTKIRKLATNDLYLISFMAFDEITDGRYFDLAVAIHKVSFRIDKAKHELFSK